MSLLRRNVGTPFLRNQTRPIMRSITEVVRNFKLRWIIHAVETAAKNFPEEIDATLAQDARLGYVYHHGNTGRLRRHGQNDECIFRERRLAEEEKVSGCAGINRIGIGNERVLRRRFSQSLRPSTEGRLR